MSKTFSDNRSNGESNSDPELDSEGDSSHGEGQLPPEHYLAQAESPDISQLQQSCYSDST
ncbi:hypothetical protein BDV11DRAFT_199340 [Aspergillus similis]